MKLVTYKSKHEFHGILNRSYYLYHNIFVAIESDMHHELNTTGKFLTIALDKNNRLLIFNR